MRKNKNRLLNELVRKLVSRLGIDSDGRVYWADDPAYKAVLGALLGESDRTVTVVDVPYQGVRYIVLGAIEPDRPLPCQPLVVRAHLHKGADPSINWGCVCKEILPRLQKLGWLGREDNLTTEEVADFFRGRCAGLGDDSNKLPRTFAPAAASSYASITVAGDLGERKATTEDHGWRSNYYEWFDLTEVPLGGSIYRISVTNTLWVFTRRDENRWEVTIVPSVSWATTSYHDGAKDFGALLDGALVAYRMATRS